MHNLGLWGTDHQYSIIPVQVWARNKSHLFALCLQPLDLRFKPRGQKKVICEIKSVRNTFAAMDIGNIRPKVSWRKYTTGSKRIQYNLQQFVFVQGQNKLHSETQSHQSEMLTPGLKSHIHLAN